MSKQKPVASDVDLLESPDIKKIKLERIQQSNISSCGNTGVQDSIKPNKQNIQQYTDLSRQGEIYF